MERKRIKIFKSGAQTTAAGQTIEFSDADLVACAAAYDPATSEAPIVIGHPKTDAPAYGWIARLIAEDGALFADLDRVNPAFAEAVNEGAYRHVSAAFYGPHNPANPKPGAYYLRHVGFLGATPPAVKGLGAVEFAAGEADVVAEIDFAESETEARGDGGACSSSPAQSGALDPDRTSLAAEGESTGANTAIPEAASLKTKSSKNFKENRPQSSLSKINISYGLNLSCNFFNIKCDDNELQWVVFLRAFWRWNIAAKWQ